MLRQEPVGRCVRLVVVYEDLVGEEERVDHVKESPCVLCSRFSCNDYLQTA